MNRPNLLDKQARIWIPQLLRLVKLGLKIQTRISSLGKFPVIAASVQVGGKRHPERMDSSSLDFFALLSPVFSGRKVQRQLERKNYG